MQNDNLKEEYEYFLEYLNDTYCIIKELSDKLNKLFYEQCDISNGLTDEARKIEGNLYYIEKFTFDIKAILDETNNVSFDESQEVVTYHNNLLIFPIANYDVDIYVDPDYDISDLWKHDD